VLPLVGCVPDQPSEAEQLAALDAFHCSVTGVSIVTLLAFAWSVTAGAVALVAVTEAASYVSLCDDAPHAARALSAASATIDFNPNSARA
jgi:hypothetical protein